MCITQMQKKKEFTGASKYIDCNFSCHKFLQSPVHFFFWTVLIEEKTFLGVFGKIVFIIQENCILLGCAQRISIYDSDCLGVCMHWTFQEITPTSMRNRHRGFECSGSFHEGHKSGERMGKNMNSFWTTILICFFCFFFLLFLFLLFRFFFSFKVSKVLPL